MKTHSQQLFKMVTNYQISRAIHTAVQLDIADQIKEHPVSCSTLSIKLELNPNRLCRLLRTLASVGIFQETEECVFGLTELSRLMQKDHPQTLYDAILVHSKNSYEAWIDLPKAIKTNCCVFEERFNMPYFDYLKAHPQLNDQFNHYMKQRSNAYINTISQAYDFNNVNSLLDVGGGYGHFIHNIKINHPHLNIGIFDQAHVIEEAKLNMNLTQYECKFISGDFFDLIPQVADGIIMKHILHDWSDDKCVNILKNCYDALPKDGQLYIVESIIEPCSNNKYAEIKRTDLHMMILLATKERSLNQFQHLFQRSGFVLQQYIKTKTKVDLLCAKKISN